ncbi:DegT/DnrJ/EryC1/StrS aminotransferase family protein [Rhodocyclus tenuis]|uniref:DegT/DnrJ/EryC1/StrS aminotransferase family protein n=1 Tax=Rhodocyclus gracilis TaxID=2929842 RepID=A0ABX0WFI1_9RHOO|nr:DegT/DnrJ/EryC1/StrS aminotransferase family protein [Rhodocyclus gracilis]NJA88041.1 DegT/DnrJ/EryC1/StrS aminotransferase family protein [Rhodocyclus gracilis]
MIPLPQSFIPFTRPSIDEATIAAVGDTLRSGWITSGPRVQEFEAALSQRFGGRTVRAFSSGTITLEIALELAGVGPGDEVITTPLSWVSTANVVLHRGARPVFVDIDPATRNIDLAAVEAAITPRTRAIIPVDLAGLPVDRDRLYAIARQHGLRVIEDAAQSLGASWDGREIGCDGDFVSFSFHANKNLTTSEGGALVLPADIDVALCERLRLQGVRRIEGGEMEVDVAGHKGNLTDLAATIGLGQLRQFDAFTARRRELAQRYFARLSPAAGTRDIGLGLPPADFIQSNWHMFQVLLPLDRLTLTRAGLIAALRERNIGAGVHYPAMHLFALYRAQGYGPGDFPHAERVGASTLTLPLFPAMADSDVDLVCAHLSDIVENARA